MKKISLEDILKDLLESEDEFFFIELPKGRQVFTSCCCQSYSNYGS